MKLSAKEVSAFGALVVAVLAAIFAPKVGSLQLENISTYIAAAIGAMIAAHHAPVVTKVVKKKVAVHKTKKKQKHPVPTKVVPKFSNLFDSISVGALHSVVSTSSDAVAGYVNGHWADYAGMVAAYPDHYHASITVFSSGFANWLDIETGDATPSDAPAWWRTMRSRGLPRPGFYANLSTMPAVIAAMNAAKIPRSEYKLWVASWTFFPHIPPGYEGCQWTDKAGIPPGSDDQSLVFTREFFLT